MKKLLISESLKLPIDLVTMVIAILAQRGAGKSHLASCIAEEMLDANQQIIVIDPTDAWHGLKSSKDGKSPGYPIAVFGGDHGDLPLRSDAGVAIASAIVAKGFSAILCVDDFSNSERQRFMGDFLETLYRRNRDAVHVFIDEADSFAPQRPMPGELRMLGAMEALVRRGRKKGIGCTLITQRPSVINKNVLTQADLLVAMRLSHPRDIEPIKEWAGVHGDMETLKKMAADLPSLATGEAWFWSPLALKLFERVKVRDRHTFDSGATPKPGQRIHAPESVAKIDLEKLGAEISATIEEAKSNDPIALRAEIARLKKEAEAKAWAKAVQPPEPYALEETYRKGVVDGWQRGVVWGIQTVKELVATKISAGVAGIQAEIESKQIPLPPAPRVDIHSMIFEGAKGSQKRVLVDDTAKNGTINFSPARQTKQVNHSEKRVQEMATVTALDRPLKPAEKRILTIAAQFPEGRTSKQFSIFVGLAMSGSFMEYLHGLRNAGLLEKSGDLYTLTNEGGKVLGPYEPLPTGRALLVYWKVKLGGREAGALQVIVDVYPKTITSKEVCLHLGLAMSGSFMEYLHHLSGLELIKGSGGRGGYVASSHFFE